jgi:hypothetical protein
LALPAKTWKQYLMQVIASANLVAALTIALAAIEPLIAGHPNWLQVLITLAIALVFAIAHSLTTQVSDPALRTVILAILAELQQLTAQQKAVEADKPMSDRPTRQVPAFDGTIYRSPDSPPHMQ